jgi:hypothetical protein
MHEMGGRIPAECGLLMANSFVSDHIAALHQAPEYGALYAAADMRPAYRDHRTILRILQWKNPRGHWLLKAPAHQSHLDALLETYPDARIIQTHRDPIMCMASTTSLMGCLLFMRSDLPFDAHAFEDIMLGEATARRLERVMEQRRTGVRCANGWRGISPRNPAASSACTSMPWRRPRPTNAPASAVTRTPTTSPTRSDRRGLRLSGCRAAPRGGCVRRWAACAGRAAAGARCPRGARVRCGRPGRSVGA